MRDPVSPVGTKCFYAEDGWRRWEANLNECLLCRSMVSLSSSLHRTPLEAHYERHKLESFRSWILYAIKEEHLKTKANLIRSLEKAFKPEYVPVLSEFEFSLGTGFDFDVEFDELVSPLVTNNWLREEKDTFTLTKEGEKRIESVLGYMRFHRNK